MEDINLDFLSTPPRVGQTAERLHTPIMLNPYSNVLQRKQKKLEIAKKIAKVDELIREVDRLKLVNNELKSQLKDFQKTAADVQNMYSEEKWQHDGLKKEYQKFKQKYDLIDVDLANKNMKYEQMSARLAEYEGRPIDYNTLLVSFIKTIQKFEGEDSLRYAKEKSLAEELKKYCLKINLKIPIVKSPKKGKCRIVKPKTVDASVQCSSLVAKPLTEKPLMQDQYTQCMATRIDLKDNLCKSKTQSKDQCQIKRRDQASQYISTMITRQTNTEKIIQKHVSTMFPEPKPTPPINDILNVFCKWADIRSITPLDHSPKSKKSNKISKLFNTTGTCTMLCNIRRKIDYLPAFALGIKQELTTPSPSPIPTSHTNSGSANRLTTSAVSETINNQNPLPNSILTLFNGNSNSPLGQLSTPAFNELWQIFGTMLFSLLQTSNAGIANIGQNSINQQQFLDWLLELYMNSQLSSNTNPQTVTHQINSTQTTPLRFEESSILSSTNIVRPQVKKSYATGLSSSIGNDIATQSESLGDNHSQLIEQQNTTTPLITDDNDSKDSNSMDIEIQNIQAAANNIEAKTEQLTQTKKNSKKSRKKTNNKKLLEKIQDLLPEAKLNKTKRKALKRLLKTSKNKLIKNKNEKLLMSQDVDNEHIETAVDFLNMFTQNQNEFQNISNINDTTNYTENEISLQNCVIENIENSSDINKQQKIDLTICKDDFKFIKPETQSYQLSKVNCRNRLFKKPIEKPKKSCLTKNIENKYKMLFGDSDNDIDDEEEEEEEAILNTVINTKDNINENQTLEKNKNSLEVIREQQRRENSSLLNNFEQTTTTIQENKTNIFFDISNQERLSIPEISTPVLENLLNVSPFNNLLNPAHNKVEEKEESIFKTVEDIVKDFETLTEKNDNCSLENSNFKYKNNIENKIENKTQNNKNVEFSYNNNSRLPAINNQPDLALQYENKKISEDHNQIYKQKLIFETIPNDFEKDFELSSDDESVLTDNDNESKSILSYKIENKSSKYSSSETEEESISSQNNEENFNGFDENIEQEEEEEDVQENHDCRKPLPDFQDTFNQRNKISNLRKTKELIKEQNFLNLEKPNNESGELESTNNESGELESTIDNLCCSIITISDHTTTTDYTTTTDHTTTTTDNNINLSTNCNDEKISIIEISKESIKKQNFLNLETTNNTNESQELESTTNNLCCSIITIPDNTTTTDNNINLSTTYDDEEISIIEISTDYNELETEQELENDLIIDEDFAEQQLSRNNSPINDEYKTISNYPIINEDHSYSKTKTKIQNNNESLNNTSNISALLNSTLYNEVLSESINPIVCDLLKNDDVLIKTPSPPIIVKAKRGRKRKSECLAEQPLAAVQPCKRSQRLRDKQMVSSEQSLNIRKTNIEINKYTRNKIISKKDLNPRNIEEIKKINLNQNTAIISDNKKSFKFEKDLKINPPQMGYFLERLETEENQEEEEEETFKKEITINKTINLNDDDIITNSSNSIETSCSISSDPEHINDKNSINDSRTLNEAFCYYTESPASPLTTNDNNNDDNNLLKATTTIINIPLERSLQHLSKQQKDETLFDSLINNYSINYYRALQPQQLPLQVFNRQQQLLQQLQMDLEIYCNSKMNLDPDIAAYNLINKLLKKSEDYDLIQKALLNVAQMAEPSTIPEAELPSIIQELPPRHLSCCLQRLFVLLRHFLNRNVNFCQQLIIKIEKLLFNSQRVEKLSLESTLNLTQLYLSVCKHQESLLQKHPGRLFIAKCLYYYNKKAILMVHEVLLWYPTILPHREDITYDRSDALITVIQEILMNTKYDMDNQQLRGRTLISKLRYEYHYEIYKPSLDEVIVNLVDKLKNSKYYNISMAFGLLCKRLHSQKVHEKLLSSHLLPLAQEYYNKALLNDEYDKRISVLLEIISMIVKPFPVETNVDVYLNEFGKFLNSFDRPLIQDAALCSIIRLQRFGYVNCFNLLQHFKPSHELDSITQAMLKTFLHRKPLTFWKTVKSQNPRNNH